MALFCPRKDRTTLYQHCRQVEKTLGKWPPAYPLPEVPPETAFVWQIFWELREHCRGGFSGPESIAFADLHAWQQVRGVRLGNWVADMILAMDTAYLAEWHKREGKNG